MTEKRFEIETNSRGATDIDFYLKDNLNELVDKYGNKIFWGNGSCNGLRQIVDLLNSLSDENGQLKLQYKELEISLLNNQLAYNELSKENEQLKSTLAYRSNQLALMEYLIDDLGSDEMKRQMEEILND